MAHFSSIHNRYDTRVLFRECSYLSAHGYDVTLWINDGQSSEQKNGVFIRSVPRLRATLPRKLFVPLLFLWQVVRHRYRIVHFHDPELIPFGLFCRHILGRSVVYDVHENYLSYNYTSIYRSYFRYLNRLAAKRLTLVFAESSYRSNYQDVNRSVEVLNYPDLSFFEKFRINDILANKPDLIYIGIVNSDRGIREIIDALASLHEENGEKVFGNLHIVGPVRYDTDLEYIKGGAYTQIKDRVRFYGQLPLDQAYNIASECRIGLAITMPTKNYKASFSTKVLEYMAVGLPAIYSDFPVYGDLRSLKIGLAVDPTFASIRQALETLLFNDSFLTRCHNFAPLIAQQYSADTQLRNLVHLYRKLE